jgi:anaerobic magnesium-protoporphyrin IX monomethyl ester cyclase
MTSITLVNFLKYPGFETSPPVGCLDLLKALNAAEHSVRFVDLQTAASTVGVQFFVELLQDDSEYLAVSAQSLMFPWLFETIKQIKARTPDKKIILGGPGVSPAAVYILRTQQCIDYAVQGEGDTALPALLKAIKEDCSLAGIPNLVWRKDGTPVMNKRLREDISQHRTDYALVDPRVYNEPMVLTSRGCPYSCAFCYNREMWPGGIRAKSLETVFAEIAQVLGLFSVNYVVIADDFFLDNRRRAKEFFDTYEKLQATFPYQIVGTRLDATDAGTLNRLKATNCVSVGYGLESGSQRVLDAIGKKLKVERVRQAVSAALRCIPQVVVSFIVGFPEESMDDFHATLQLALELQNEGCCIMMSFLRPQLGTPLYARHSNSLKFLKEALVLQPTGMSADMLEVIRADPELYCWYYTYDSPALTEKFDEYQQAGFCYMSPNC